MHQAVRYNIASSSTSGPKSWPSAELQILQVDVSALGQFTVGQSKVRKCCGGFTRGCMVQACHWLQVHRRRLMHKMMCAGDNTRCEPKIGWAACGMPEST